MMLLLLGSGNSHVCIPFPGGVTRIFSLLLGLRSMHQHTPNKCGGQSHLSQMCPSAPFTVSSIPDKNLASFHTRVQDPTLQCISEPVFNSVLSWSSGQPTAVGYSIKLQLKTENTLLPTLSWSLTFWTLTSSEDRDAETIEITS